MCVCVLDFDCILTSLDVKCIGRSRYQLAECEAARAAGILARAVARDSGQLAADESQSQQQQTLGCQWQFLLYCCFILISSLSLSYPHFSV